MNGYIDNHTIDVIKHEKMNSITSNAVTNSLSYSTEETLTGGTWIDGKPIYRKVYRGVTDGVSLGISSLDEVVSLRAISSPKLGFSNWQAMPYSWNSNETSIGISTSITWSIGYRDNYVPSTTLSIILEYIKTTD